MSSRMEKNNPDCRWQPCYQIRDRCCHLHHPLPASQEVLLLPGGCWHSLEFSGSCCLLAARRWALRLRQLWPLPGAGMEPSGPLNQGYEAWEGMKQGRSTGLGSGPHQIPVFPLLVVTWWASLGTPLGLLCPSGHRGFKESPSAVGPAARCILCHPGHRSLKFPSCTSER